MQASSRSSNSLGTLTTLMFVLLLAYFLYHAFSGQRGFLSLVRLTKEVEESRAKLDEMNADRLRLEHKVSLLREESLDLDMLDEEARKLLGYSSPNETLYIVE